MDWFKNHYIDWKQYDYHSDMKDEIKQFSADNEIDNNENQVLKKILDYNLIKKNREKQLLQNTTREALNDLIQIPSLLHSTKLRIENILNWNNNENNETNNSKYIQKNGLLKNVLKITLKTLVSIESNNIENIIWNKYNFSITNRQWKTYNVFLWKINWVENYYYSNGPRKNQRVKIYNWYKIWPTITESNLEKRESDNKEPKNNKELLKKLEKDFPSIDNISSLIVSLKKLKSTRDIVNRKIDEAKRNNYSDDTLITISYYWKRRDKVRVSDLKGILKAINFTLDTDQRWIDTAKDWKIDNKSIKDYVTKRLSKENITWLAEIYANAVKYVWSTEANRYLQKEIKKYTWLDIKNQAWCAAFVKMILIKSWHAEDSKKMNNAALSAFWITKAWWHIWISAGWWKFIDWNSWRNTDRVTSDSIYRSYRKKGYIWWILPEDLWNRDKVHFSNTNVPPWAIIVFARWSNVEQKAKYTKLYLQWKINRKTFNRYT